jgi:hypothetical protein
LRSARRIDTQRALDLIRAGNYLEVAATAAGIHRSPLIGCYGMDATKKRGRYRKFLNQVEKAQVEAESRDVALIVQGREQ